MALEKLVSPRPYFLYLYYLYLFLYKDESVSADELLTIAQRNHSIAEGEIAEIRGCAV